MSDEKITDINTERNARIEAEAQAERDANTPTVARSLTMFETTDGHFGVSNFEEEGYAPFAAEELVGLLERTKTIFSAQIVAHMVINMGRRGNANIQTPPPAKPIV